MSKLIINLSQDYKVKLENKSEFPNSIFKDIYRFALDKVIEIVTNTYPRFESSDFTLNENPNGGDDANNIIAFVGERGKGKSSSMISFRNAILKKEDNESDNLGFNKLHQVKFASIDVIDPSFFKGNENLFEIILAKMFSKFQNDLINRSFTFSDESKRRLMKSFHNVYGNLQLLNSGRNELFKLEAIEALSKLGTSSNLKFDFTNLLNNYLEIYGSHFLVITIDDFDLNYSNVFEMLEDIRQFLVQNKILILVACKVEQILDALEFKLSKEGIGTRGEYHKNEEVKDRASRYLDKLIPFNRRSYLPSLESINDSDFEIVSNIKDTQTFTATSQDIESFISLSFYEKFNIFLPKGDLRLNTLIPRTVREMQALMRVLVHHSFDFGTLKSYLLDQIYKADIYYVHFNELDECNDNQLHLMLIRKIRAVLNERKYDINSKNNIIPKYLQLDELCKSKVPHNVSVGDILHVINLFEELVDIDDVKCLKFIDYLKLYYVIRVTLIKSKLETNNFFFPINYGFHNGMPQLLTRKRKISRDFFKVIIRSSQLPTSNEERYILFSLFYSLGKVNEDYRNEPFAEQYLVRFRYGIISPFSILGSFYEINKINEILSEDKQIQSSDWVNYNINSIKESKLYKQLFNPFFTLTLFNSIKKHCNQLTKDRGFISNFDDILGLFIGSFYSSLEEMQEQYEFLRDGVSLLEEFSNFPIIVSIVSKIIQSNQNNPNGKRVLNVLRKISDRQNHIAGTSQIFQLSDEFVQLFDDLRESSYKLTGNDYQDDYQEDDLEDGTIVS